MSLLGIKTLHYRDIEVEDYSATEDHQSGLRNRTQEQIFVLSNELNRNEDFI